MYFLPFFNFSFPKWGGGVGIYQHPPSPAPMTTAPFQKLKKGRFYRSAPQSLQLRTVSNTTEYPEELTQNRILK
jgi:hypothetical protein